MKDAIADKKTIGERIFGVKEVLESEGYLAELQEIDTHFNLRVFNCPVPKLAAEFQEACHYDLQIFRDLFGKEVSREECIIEGNPSCTYNIPKLIPR
jgi:predicted ArsR family transcriptional regulator